MESPAMPPSRLAVFALLAFVLSTLAACGTSPAPDFRGRWKPANAFSEEPQQIPLRQAPEFAVSPADATLKSILERWASEAGASVQYAAPVDYTLHAAASGVSARDLLEALRQLEAAYSRQALRIRLMDGVIEVSSGDRAAVSEPSAASPGSP